MLTLGFFLARALAVWLSISHWVTRALLAALCRVEDARQRSELEGFVREGDPEKEAARRAAVEHLRAARLRWMRGERRVAEHPVETEASDALGKRMQALELERWERAFRSKKPGDP